MSELTEFFERLYELLKHEEIRKSLFLVLPLAMGLGFWFGRYFPKYRHTTFMQGTINSPIEVPSADSRLAEMQQMIDDLEKRLAIAPANVNRAREAVSSNGPGLWLATSPAPPTNYNEIRSSIPIYTVANLKGGVGKTTIATGLAAHFANPFGDRGRKRERVLLIDLDFQGSLSSMALTVADRIPQHEQQSHATRLISGTCAGSDLLQMHQRVKGLDTIPNGASIELYAIPAYYDLAQAENRLMIEWLLSEEPHDIRYNLSSILLSKEVQKRYDRIIIDAPPRLTTAHVQALAASTHVIIPTVLDQLSGEAVGSFVEQAIIHWKLWPYLKIAGIVGSMTELDQDIPLRTHEEAGLTSIGLALEQVKDAYGLKARPAEVLTRSAFIPEFNELGRAAGTRIGYLSKGTNRTGTDKMRRVFDSLGKAVTTAAANAKELRDLVRS
jgi:cellulose biosynthesis protein BcsQ